MAKRSVDIVFRAFDKATGVMRNLGSSVDRLGKRFNVLAMAGTALTGYLGYRLVGALKNAVIASTGYEKQLAMVSTMLDDQGMKLLPQYRREIERMAVAFGEGTETITKGLYDILSAGVDPAHALDVLDVSMRAATGGITDTGTAADALTTVLNSYHLAAKDATAVSDVMFQTIKRGKINYQQLSDNIGKATSMAYTAGISLTDMTAGIATMTRGGRKADIVMTDMVAFLAAIVKPSHEAQGVLNELGASFDTASLRGIGLAGTLEQLNSASEKQLATIFPRKSLAGVSVMLNDIQGLKKDMDLMRHSTGAAGEAYNKMANIADKRLERTTESIKTVTRALGEGMTPGVLDAADAFAKAAPEAKTFGRDLGSVVSVGADVILWLEEMRQKIARGLKEAFIRLSAWITQAPEQLGLMFNTTVHGVKLFWGDIKHWFVYGKDLLLWFLKNWKDVFAAAWDGLKTFISNVGVNMIEFGKAVKGALMLEGWDFEWTGLLEGFEANLEGVPKAVARVMTVAEKQTTESLRQMKAELARNYDATLKEMLTGMDKENAYEDAMKKQGKKMGEGIKKGVKAGMSGLNMPGSGARGAGGEGKPKETAGLVMAAVMGRLETVSSRFMTSATHISQRNPATQTARNTAENVTLVKTLVSLTGEQTDLIRRSLGFGLAVQGIT